VCTLTWLKILSASLTIRGTQHTESGPQSIMKIASFLKVYHLESSKDGTHAKKGNSSTVWFLVLRLEILTLAHRRLGLHASISVHLSDRYFNSEKGRWESNFRMFHDRVGAYPERVQNLYVVYTLLLRAVTKIQSQMLAINFSMREDDNVRIKVRLLLSWPRFCKSSLFQKALFEKLYKACPKYSKKFDSHLFAISPSHAEQLKATFRNLARLMDCVSCQRCRLWGKVQIYGIGTALKILTSHDARYYYRMQLSRLR
jgi:hypothetical protein